MADTTTLAAWLDNTVPPLLAHWRVAGLSVCVVQPDMPPTCMAWGYRDAAKRKPMRIDTPIPIASMSKAFTTTAFALAVGRGEIDWEARVREWVPELQLADARAAHQLTVLDMLSHRSGLPRHDGVWLGQQMTAAQLLSALPHLAPSRGLRESFQYQNLMYALAGLVLERASGRCWADCVMQDVLQPLGMVRSAALLSQMASHASLARGRTVAGESHVAERARDLGVMGPTGGVISCAADLSRFLALQLGDSPQSDKVRLADDDRRLMHSPLTPLDWPMSAVEFEAQFYGLGWFGGRYRGVPLLHHGGNLPGFCSHMALLPQQRSAFALLINEGPSPLRDVLSNMLTDRLLGATALPWSQRHDALIRAARTAKRLAASRAAASNTALQAFAHPAYGEIALHRRGTRLAMDIQGHRFALTAVAGDTYRLPSTAPQVWARRTVHLVRDAQAQVCGLRATLEAMAPGIVFEALPTAARAPLPGHYEAGLLHLQIDACPNGRLLLSRPTAPRRTLRALGDGGWQVIGGRAESVRVCRDARRGHEGLLYSIGDACFFVRPAARA
jgi:CubicO group peptidase (beta-lactamase class C family)